MTHQQNNQTKTQIIWLCRHGNRIDMVDPTWKGHDPHLSEIGIEQAKDTALRLRHENIRHIFASPFLRTIQTAYYIAKVLDLTIKIENGVCEWLNPIWYSQPPEYLTHTLLNERYPRIDLKYKSIFNPQWPEETLEKSRMRCQKTANLLLEKYHSDFLVVGHAASVLGMAKGILGNDPPISAELCSLTKIIRTEDQFFLKLNGDTSHLKNGENKTNNT